LWVKPLNQTINFKKQRRNKGASGAAMAAPDCLFGFIANETVDDINIDGQNCYISDVLVLGNVTIRNGG